MVIGMLRAALRARRVQAIRALLSWRVQATFPTLRCDPAAIWDYPFRCAGDIEMGVHVTVLSRCEIIFYPTSPRSAVRGSLALGDHCIVSTGVNLRAAGGRIELGRSSCLAQHVVVVAANHLPSFRHGHVRGAWDESRTGVIIGENVWVGAGSVLLPGTNIGDHSIIAAGSVVNGVVPPREIWGGVPARRIKDVVVDE